MKKYKVIIDYVTTATIIVEARDEESAGKKAMRYVHTRKGFEDYLKNSGRNVVFGNKDYADWGGDGFDIPMNPTELGSGYLQDAVIDLTKEV